MLQLETNDPLALQVNQSFFFINLLDKWLEDKMARAGGILKVAVVISGFLLIIFMTFQLLEINPMDFRFRNVISQSMPLNEASPKPVKYKCGLSKSCPPEHFAFRITSGVASVMGPRICLEDKIIMSAVKNNVGRGINIALINGRTAEVIKTEFFNFWGDVAPFVNFLKGIAEGTVVMMASFDNISPKLNDETKKLIADLGSSAISSIGVRDNWVFVGGKGIKTKSPFEQHIKNNAETNKFDGWPDMLEMEGCVPQRQDLPEISL